jgi:serine/threonine protein kinase
VSEDVYAALALPKSLAPRFRAIRVLGTGTSGTVLLAQDQELDRPVAIKLLTADLEKYPELAARFRQEANLAASIAHPHLVQVYDSGGGSGDPLYILYQYVGGEDLKSRIEASSRPDPEEAMGWAEQLAGALGALHDAKLVHRDVKPANVLLDDQGHPYLIDLGLARAPERTGLQTRTGTLLGTPLYMAPEVWRLETATSAADQFGLAAVLHECVYGRSPYPFVRIEDLLEWSTSEEELVLPATREGHPPTLRPALVRALRTDPRDRFPDIRDFARALAGELPAEAPAPRSRPTPRATPRASHRATPRAGRPAAPRPAPPAPRRTWNLAVTGLASLGLAVALARRSPDPPPSPLPSPAVTPTASLEDPAEEVGARLLRAFRRLVADHTAEISGNEGRARHLEETATWAVAPSTRPNWDFTWDYLMRYLEQDRQRSRPPSAASRASRDSLMDAVLPQLLHLFEDIEQLEKNARERLAGLSIERGPVRPAEELREMASLGSFVRDKSWRWLDGLTERPDGPTDLELLVATWVTAHSGWPGARWLVPRLARRARGDELEAPAQHMAYAERRLFYSQEIAGILGCQAFYPILERYEELAARPGSERQGSNIPWSIDGFLLALRHFARHACRTEEDLARLERIIDHVDTDLRTPWTATRRQSVCHHLQKGNGHLELLEADEVVEAEDVLKRFRALLADRCGPLAEGG